MRPDRHSRIARALFVITFCSYASFLQDPRNANAATRMFMVYSILDRGSLSIDEFAANTVDKATSHGHFYSDKAPGLSLMAVPAARLVRPAAIQYEQAVLPASTAARFRGWPAGHVLTTYAATLATSALLTAFAVAALFLVCASTFKSTQSAVIAAIAFGLGSPAFGWATAFLGHAPAMALSVIGLALLQCIRSTGGAHRRDYWCAAGGAACLTLAVVTEFTAAPAAAMIAGYGALRVRMANGDRVRLLLVGVCAAAVCTAPLLVHNSIAFGAPLALGYQAVPDFPGMKQGFLGVTTPSASVLWEITFGMRRGILWICPILALAVPGAASMLRDRNQRGLAVLVILVSAYYLLLNAAYHYWDGGYSTGPRHVTGMLPFTCIAIGAVWDSARKPVRALVLATLLGSLSLALLCTIVGMFAPDTEAHLLTGFLIPGLLQGSNTSALVSVFGLLRSRYFLIAFPALMAGALAWLWRIVCEEPTAAEGTPSRTGTKAPVQG